MCLFYFIWQIHKSYLILQASCKSLILFFIRHWFNSLSRSFENGIRTSFWFGLPSVRANYELICTPQKFWIQEGKINFQEQIIILIISIIFMNRKYDFFFWLKNWNFTKTIRTVFQKLKIIESFRRLGRYFVRCMPIFVLLKYYSDID